MTDILRISGPIGLWLAGFCAVYGLQGLACSRHWPGDLAARPALALAVGLALAAQGALLVLAWRRPSPSRWTQGLTLGLAATAAAATAWTLAPALVLPVCG